jgi:hypothetical protein
MVVQCGLKTGDGCTSSPLHGRWSYDVDCGRGGMHIEWYAECVMQKKIDMEMKDVDDLI